MNQLSAKLKEGSERIAEWVFDMACDHLWFHLLIMVVSSIVGVGIAHLLMRLMGI